MREQKPRFINRKKSRIPSPDPCFFINKCEYGECVLLECKSHRLHERKFRRLECVLELAANLHATFGILINPSPRKAGSIAFCDIQGLRVRARALSFAGDESVYKLIRDENRKYSFVTRGLTAVSD